MDITVRINGMSRQGGDVTPQWITESIRTARQAGPVCVTVTLAGPLVNLTLATPGCAGGRGGRTLDELSEAERELFDLWRRHRLDQLEFPPGGVVAFLKATN